MKLCNNISKLELAAFYDLSVSPTGFDFIVFLTLAELARMRGHYSHFKVVVVPASDDRFWDNESYSTDYKAWRLIHLLVPLTTLFPHCAGISISVSRDEAETLTRRAARRVFPEGYQVRQPILEAYQLADIAAAVACGEAIPAWQPPRVAEEFVEQWFGQRARGRKIVTITLREASYHIHQNSNLTAWAAFARELDPDIYFPVFVRDTERALEPVPEVIRQFAVFEEASFNVPIRAALYLRSHVNLMASGGPMFLTWLHSDCRVIVFKLLNLAELRSTPIPLRALGIEPGRQPSFLHSHQRIIWQNDDLDAIRGAFLDMERDLTSGEAGPYRRK